MRAPWTLVRESAVGRAVRRSTAWQVLTYAVKSADRHSIARLGAALAFYSLFSLAPVLLVAITAAGILLEQGAAQEAIRDYVTRVVGPEGARAVGAAMRNASVTIPSGPEAVASIFFFFMGSTAAFNALLGTLNLIWGVEETPRSAVWRFVRRRLIAFGLVVGVGVFALVSLILSAVLSNLSAYFPEALAQLPYASRVSNLALWTVLLTVLFGTIYRVVPDTILAWRDVVIGAALTAVLFSVGTMLIGEYIGRAGLGSVFGAAGSVVLLLFWVYYSAQVFLLGAEVTHAITVQRDRESR